MPTPTTQKNSLEKTSEEPNKTSSLPDMTTTADVSTTETLGVATTATTEKCGIVLTVRNAHI
jgi:hypothetical protein